MSNNEPFTDGIIIPEPFFREDVDSRYAQIPLSNEVLDLMHQYFTAMAHLYGVIPVSKAFEIILTQNKEIMTVDQYSSFCAIARYDPDVDYCILESKEIYPDALPDETNGMYIVDGFLADFADDLLYCILASQDGKPYYVPNKKSLLKYSNELYCEPTPQAEKLMDFIRPRAADSEYFEDAIFILTYHARYEYQNDLDIVDELEGVALKDEDEISEFWDLYDDFCKHSRLPHNRGYTPAELLSMLNTGNRTHTELIVGPKIRAMIKRGEIDADDIRRDIITSNFPAEIKYSVLKELYEIAPPKSASKGIPKVGRNDPCPCGSGKKYKKCCGR